MKTASLRFLRSVWHEARTSVLSAGPDEAVAFMTARHFGTKDKVVFLPQVIVPAEPNDYLCKGPSHLEVSPMYVNRVLNLAENQGNTVIMVHSHPFEHGTPRYSLSDNHGELLTAETISSCLNHNPPVGSVLFGKHSFSARTWVGRKKTCCPSSVTILSSDCFEFPGENLARNPSFEPLTERQTRALGSSTQAVLESLQVGVVGLGGTGSAVLEQLVRMGVNKLTIVDHDKTEPSNWSRLYGSTWQETSRSMYKVDVVSAHLRRIKPALDLTEVRKSVMTDQVLKSLAECDLIFSCLDRQAPRAVLNELSYQCFVPVIDVGVGINRGDSLAGAIRATVVGPGLPCLLCQGVIRPDVISAEHMMPEEYESRRAEGYAPRIDRNAPSLISFTTLASSLGLLLLQDFLDCPDQSIYSTLIFDIASKEVIKLRSQIKSDCICNERLGAGFGVPFSVAD